MAVAWLSEIEERDPDGNALCNRPVHARVRAAVLAEVEAAAGRRPYERGAEDIQDRWGVEVHVRPPGYEWRAPLL